MLAPNCADRHQAFLRQVERQLIQRLEQLLPVPDVRFGMVQQGAECSVRQPGASLHPGEVIRSGRVAFQQEQPSHDGHRMLVVNPVVLRPHHGCDQG
ncbi:MAG TPA: hypothetical protein VGA78_09485 [Gemmatimonadales bacterium]